VEFLLRRSRIEIKLGIERIEPKVVDVFLIRRVWTAITDLAEVISPSVAPGGVDPVSIRAMSGTTFQTTQWSQIFPAGSWASGSSTTSASEAAEAGTSSILSGGFVFSVSYPCFSGIDSPSVNVGLDNRMNVVFGWQCREGLG